MSRLQGRVAIVTGAGRGLGRSHARQLAQGGAAVVVNDLGTSKEGAGTNAQTAQSVVSEIASMGGVAIASCHDVSDWSQAEELISLAVDHFGGLDVLVNNAGVLRDRTLAKISEEEWDVVIRVHLKGHAAPSHHAMAYWRQQSKAGRVVRASAIHTTSVSGLLGTFGQANYSAAKLGIIALSRVMAIEGARIGVRSNALSPSANTRMGSTGSGQLIEAQSSYSESLSPSTVSPIVAWLAEADCRANSQIFHVRGSSAFVVSLSHVTQVITGRPDLTPELFEREFVHNDAWPSASQFGFDEE